MRTKSYRIDIPPIAWKRAGHTQSNNKRMYDTQEKYKTHFGLYMLQQHRGEPAFANPIDIEAVFFMPLPKTPPKRTIGSFCVGKSDLDNLIKFLLDSAVDANILQDDNIVCSLKAKKIYSKDPRTEFIITEI